MKKLYLLPAEMENIDLDLSKINPGTIEVEVNND